MAKGDLEHDCRQGALGHMHFGHGFAGGVVLPGPMRTEIPRTGWRRKLRNRSQQVQTAQTESWSETHAMIPEDRVVMGQTRAIIGPNKGKLRGIAARAPYEAIMGRVVAPDRVTFRHDTSSSFHAAHSVL